MTVILVAISFGFLMAPAVWHRMLFRRGHRENILPVANRFALCGIAFLAASMTGTVLLIAEVAVGGSCRKDFGSVRRDHVHGAVVSRAVIHRSHQELTQAPVSTARVLSLDHCDHEPGNSVAS